MTIYECYYCGRVGVDHTWKETWGLFWHSLTCKKRWVRKPKDSGGAD